MEYRYMPPIRRLIEESDSRCRRQQSLCVSGVLQHDRAQACCSSLCSCDRKLGEPRVLSIREHRFPFLVKVDNWNRSSAKELVPAVQSRSYLEPACRSCWTAMSSRTRPDSAGFNRNTGGTLVEKARHAQGHRGDVNQT